MGKMHSPDDGHVANPDGNGGGPTTCPICGAQTGSRGLRVHIAGAHAQEDETDA